MLDRRIRDAEEHVDDRNHGREAHDAEDGAQYHEQDVQDDVPFVLGEEPAQEPQVAHPPFGFVRHQNLISNLRLHMRPRE